MSARPSLDNSATAEEWIAARSLLIKLNGPYRGGPYVELGKRVAKALSAENETFAETRYLALLARVEKAERLAARQAEELDQKAEAALRDLRAPVVPAHQGLDCGCDSCEDGRRGWVGLRPKQAFTLTREP